jgi:hypothetical protein
VSWYSPRMHVDLIESSLSMPCCPCCRHPVRAASAISSTTDPLRALVGIDGTSSAKAFHAPPLPVAVPHRRQPSKRLLGPAAGACLPSLALYPCGKTPLTSVLVTKPARKVGLQYAPPTPAGCLEALPPPRR